jgi:predicted aldo/keto reductase-like oxidoreductase
MGMRSVVFLPNTTGIIESTGMSWHETRNAFKFAVEENNWRKHITCETWEYMGRHANTGRNLYRLEVII